MKLSTCPDMNEMGPCQTSRAWYFHSPGIIHNDIVVISDEDLPAIDVSI